jgi:hypothetical protein
MLKKVAPMPSQLQQKVKNSKSNDTFDRSNMQTTTTTTNQQMLTTGTMSSSVVDIRNQSSTIIVNNKITNNNNDEKNNRIVDYTDLVKRKYFGQQQKEEPTITDPTHNILLQKDGLASVSKNYISPNGNNKTKSQSDDNNNNNNDDDDDDDDDDDENDTDSDTDSENDDNDLHLFVDEIQSGGDDGDGISFKPSSDDSFFVPASDQSSLLLSGTTGVGGRPNNTDENTTPEDLLGPSPLAIYSEGAAPLTIGSSTSGGPRCNNNNNNNKNKNKNNPDTDESIVGHMSPVPDSHMYMLSADNTPNSHQLAATIACIPSDTNHNNNICGSLGSAASSRGSLSTAATLSVPKQPFLYSAIGSLEHANCNSFTKLNKRFLAPTKEFCKPGGGGAAPSTLIPPARNYHQAPGQQRRTNSSSSLLPALSSTDLQTIEQNENDRNYTSRASNVYGTDTNNTNSKKKTSNSSTTSTTSSNRNATNKIDGDNDNDNDNDDDGKKNNSSIPSSIPVKKISTSRRERRSTAISSNTTKTKKSSNRNSNQINKNKNNNNSEKSAKKVSYDPSTAKTNKNGEKSKKKGGGRGPIEMFRPSSDAYTPRIERKHIKYKAAENRTPVQHMSSPMGTLQRPNFRDALRRVAMILHQHIVKIESRFEQQGGGGGQCSSTSTRSGSQNKSATTDDGLFHASMRDIFNEDCYRTPTYKCHMARIPMARPGMVYGLRKVQVMYRIPSETEIYDFAHQLFQSVQLSSECSIVCLIYVERLMEIAKVPLLACTWRPIFMCGLLLASKVWQDLSSWNIEFSSVYPQFSLESINKLELNFLRNVKWDLYISSR